MTPSFVPSELIKGLDISTTSLAETVSLAVRIEPQLLRKMRLELFPTTNAGVEADLWFSPLVESRTPSGIVFQRGVLQLLRQRLAGKVEQLEAAWRVTESVHRYVSPAILAEEKLAYLALSGKHEEMRKLLRSVVATLVSPRGRRLAGWAARAVGWLPEEAKHCEEAQMLAFGASLRLGEGGLGIISAGQAADWSSWLSPDDLETVAVGVTLLEDAVEFGPVGRTLSHRIELPKTNPVVVELGWQDGTQERSERVILDPQNLKIVEIGPAVTQIDIRTVLGDSYWLTMPEPRARESVQRKIGRVRPPRVQITYDIETGGAIEQKELPFVVGVLADLSGPRETSLPELRKRRFVEITADNFDAVVAATKARLSFYVDSLDEDGSQIRVELLFSSMADFEPTNVARQVAPLNDLLEARTRIGEFQSVLNRDQKLQDMIREGLTSAGTREVSQSSRSQKEQQFDYISRLVGAASSLERTRAQELVTAFVENINLSAAATDLETAITTGIAEIDSRLSRQVRQILHHPEFQALESIWRGVRYLLAQTEISATLKIRVLNVKKDELAADLTEKSEFKDRTVFREICEEPYGIFDGEPFGLLIGAYEFRESEEDVELLQNLSRIAAASHVPFLAAAAPGILQLDNFASLGSVSNLYEMFESPEYSRWRQFRDFDDSRYIGLVLPHILLRLPYGKTTTPIEEFDFEEFTEVPQPLDFLWGNAAFALAGCVTQSFARYGWCAAIHGVEGGGLLEGLPIHSIDADGDLVMRGPTDVAINDRRESELSTRGFIPLCHYRGTDRAAFLSVNSVHKPPQYNSAEATEASRLSVQLPYVFAISRFAQYLRCMMRDKIGSFMSREQCEQFLNHWISNYVLLDEHADQASKAKFPLREARIDVEEVERESGTYRAVAYLRPHFQLEELSVSLRCVVLLPASAKYA